MNRLGSRYIILSSIIAHMQAENPRNSIFIPSLQHQYTHHEPTSSSEQDTDSVVHPKYGAAYLANHTKASAAHAVGKHARS